MPSALHDLHKLDASTFEHLVTSLALRVLGAGATGFGPGPDGGRDGSFHGRASYPSPRSNWTGLWCIQSKFMLPQPGANPHKWLLKQIERELAEYQKPHSKRTWPDNWIVATNIDPSGVAETGAFDKAQELVAQARPKLAKRFHIWGGRKILDLLAQHPDVAAYYGEFITPGQLLRHLFDHIGDIHAPIEQVVRYLVVGQLDDQQFTKLEQAGSNADTRPGIHKVFSDLPFRLVDTSIEGMAAAQVARASAENQRIRAETIDSEAWRLWRTDPGRSRVWFVKGGPGQGKSTLTQYICQIQRAAIILGSQTLGVLPRQRELCREIRLAATEGSLWPLVPRVPITIELKEFAQWYAGRTEDQSTRALTFLSDWLTKKIGQTVQVGTLRRALGGGRWIVVFDGLDEVPGDIKDRIADEVTFFINETLVSAQADCLVMCTSRPQGYSGQFNALEAATIDLSPLSADQALKCAIPVLRIDRSESEFGTYLAILKEATNSSTIMEIMKTPLQAHIMAVVVRDGGRPPERKWQLFTNFYQTVKRREINKNLGDKEIASLLQQEDQLLKSLHTRLGFRLHARAEVSKNAATALRRDELEILIREVVNELKDRDVEHYVRVLMRATTERLLLVSTPDAGTEVRFDIRPLQEFFAAEYLYETDKTERLVDRLRVIVADSHWKEVMHFLFSGLIESGRKGELAASIDVLLERDNGGDDPQLRLLCQRLAHGSMIAVRLLFEGMLEQDKRVRAQFRETLLPLLGNTRVEPLVRTDAARHSREWLIDVLIDSILERAEPECIGAAIAAVLTVADHPRIDAVRKFLVQSTRDFQRCLFEALGNHSEAPSTTTSPWVTCAIIEILSQPSWYELGYPALRSMFDLLESSPVVAECAIEAGLPKSVAQHVQLMFEDDLDPSPEDREDFFGLVEVEYSTTPVVDWRRWDDRLWEDFGGCSGIFGAVYAALKLAKSKRTKDAKNLFLALGGGRLVFLPPGIRAYFSHEAIWAGDWEQLPVRRLLEKRYPGGRRIIVFDGEPTSRTDWKAAFESNPAFALDVMFDVPALSSPHFQNFARTADGARLILSAARIGVGHIFNHVPLWKGLFALPRIGPKLRALALDAADREVGNSSYYIYGAPEHGFHIAIPDEAAFLPHVANWIYNEARKPGYRGQRSTGDVVKRMSELAESFGLSAEALGEIWRNGQFAKRVRAAAASLYIVCRGGAQSDLSLEDILSIYEPKFGTMLISCVAIAHTERVRANDVASLSLVSALFEQLRNDFRARKALDEVIGQWREFARAPVTSSELRIWN